MEKKTKNTNKTSKKTDKKANIKNLQNKVATYLKTLPQGQTIINLFLLIALLICFYSLHNLSVQNAELRLKADAVKPIYVFNLEKVIASSDLVAIQKDFEAEVQKLSKEVETAQKKIAGLKKSKVNEDFSEMYLKSLVAKRDEMLKNHEKQMQEVTNSINKALVKVAKDKNAPTVFNYRAVSVTTDNVIDISDEVMQQINTLLKKTQNDTQE